MKLRFFIILILSFWISGNAFGQDIKVEMGPDDKGKPLPTTSIGKDKLKALTLKVLYEMLDKIKEPGKKRAKIAKEIARREVK